MKTLYITDLDGTLLDPGGTLRPEAAQALNRLIRQGVLFSAATARSPVSVQPLLAGLELKLPLILLNGVFLYDTRAGHVLSHAAIDRTSAETAVQIYEKHGKHPFLFTYNGRQIRYHYTELRTPEQRAFYRARRALQPDVFFRHRRLCVPQGEEAVYFTIMDRYEELQPLREELERRCAVRTAFYPDTYTAHWFLEIFSRGAGKRNGALALKQYAGADRICAFGDNLNDLGLFEAADLRIAVSNAVDELKAQADQIIGSNTENGVVRFMEEEVDRL